MYSSEKNVQILLALLKAHGIKKIVVSPGSANASLVASLQYDKEYELYSSVDERSAAYIACGLAEESGEAVALSCTGATASRNYLPALTEAFYRKLPIIAITATRPINMIGQNRDQVIDRTTVLNDVAKISVQIPIVENEDDEWECNLKINNALLELRRNGLGPVHINLTTSYSLNFSIKELPKVRLIHRYGYYDKMPESPTGKIGIFVGAHSKWDSRLTSAVDEFCEKYDAVVLCDQTSNYKGKYGIYASLLMIQSHLAPTCLDMDILIHIGNISASWPSSMKEVWRINSDGEVRDTYRKLRYVFEMEELHFFEHYNAMQIKKQVNYFEKWTQEYRTLFSKLETIDKDLPFSSVWIAKNMHSKMPTDCVMHFGILNSLRCWNFFELDHSIIGYSNTGGFGIDGCISSLIGASLSDGKKIYFGIFGDLAFFYDMNSLGNRHIGSNVRILVVNNGLGGEFKNDFCNVQKAGLGDLANEFIAAEGHYGKKSPELVKHYAENLGFEYICASDKVSFNEGMLRFINEKMTKKPMLFEVFVQEHNDSRALKIVEEIGTTTIDITKKLALDSTKKIAKNVLGENGMKILKKIIH